MVNKTIAFHSLFAQNALRPTQPRLGGAEKRSVLLCRMLAESGHSTALLMADPGRANRISANPFGIRPIYHPKYKLKQGIQVQKPTFKADIWHKIEDKLRKTAGLPLRNVPALAQKRAFAPFFKAKANLWVGLSLNDAMLELAQFCHKTKTPFLLGLAHDIDLDFLAIKSGVDRFGASREKKRKTLELASAVLAQNKYQFNTVKSHFPNLPVFYLPNPIEIKKANEVKQREGALWIGKMDSNKNPEALVRLAHKLPSVSFILLANPAEYEIEKNILSSLPPNVKRIKNVWHEDISRILAGSSVHISTSLQEGFPNTFLEAALAETPTVSLHVDPDGLMQTGHFGFCAQGDESKLPELVLKAIHKGKDVEEIIQKTNTYIQAQHSYEQVKKQWLQMVGALIAN